MHDLISLHYHLDGKERAGCFAKFVFLVSGVCFGLFLPALWDCLQFVIVVYPDCTHFFSHYCIFVSFKEFLLTIPSLLLHLCFQNEIHQVDQELPYTLD